MIETIPGHRDTRGNEESKQRAVGVEITNEK